MRFQPRDGEILKTIYESDGVIARRHLKELFWTDKTERAMEQRLAKLKNAEYISWPNREQRKYHPIPEPICWLGWRGVLSVAGIFGKTVDPPKSNNEYQLRSLQKRLRDVGIRWVREPHWIQLAHDLSVIDFKLAMDRVIEEIPNLSLSRWIPEGYFRSALATQNNSQVGMEKQKGKKKGIIPDGYFEIIDKERLNRGEPHKARFLLEMDMITHDNPSFGLDKVRSGLDYIRGSAYRNLSGSNDGLWLVVTKGKGKRIENLLKQVQKHALKDTNYFFISSFTQAVEMNPLTDPIWWQVGIDQPVALLD